MVGTMNDRLMVRYKHDLELRYELDLIFIKKAAGDLVLTGYSLDHCLSEHAVLVWLRRCHQTHASQLG